MRSSWLVGALTIASLAWTGGATAHVGHHARAADCCYEIAYDQYEFVFVWYVANGNRAGKQGQYQARVKAHVRMLATAVTDPQYVHFIPVTEERAASVDESDFMQTRTPAPNPSAQPGPWQEAPDCLPTGAARLHYSGANDNSYARDAGTSGGLVRIDRSQKRTEVVLGPPIRGWKFACGELYRPQRGGSGEGAYPITAFKNLTPISQSLRALPLVNSNGKPAVCHVAGYQRVDLQGGDLLYQFGGTYSASIRIKKVPSGARKAEVRKLGKLEGKAPQWLPGIYDADDNPGALFSPTGLEPYIPRTGCSRG